MNENEKYINADILLKAYRQDFFSLLVRFTTD